MKYLIVIFYLVNGQPKDADVIGVASDAQSCVDVAVEVLGSRSDAVKQLIDSGVRPQVHCLPAPEFDPESKQLVVRHDV